MIRSAAHETDAAERSQRPRQWRVRSCDGDQWSRQGLSRISTVSHLVCSAARWRWAWWAALASVHHFRWPNST